MINRADLKTRAKQMMSGNIGMLILCYIIVMVLTGVSVVLTAIPLVGWIGTICVTGALSLGTAYIYLNLARGFQPDIKILFSGFRRLGDVLLLTLMIVVFTCLWSLLFIVPGIIKAISYSQAYYILAEHPEMSAKQALDESIAIMDGHKADYFVLGLSFILWLLLCDITCGLAMLYVGPYMQATFVNFYEAIKNPVVVNTNNDFTDNTNNTNNFYQA